MKKILKIALIIIAALLILFNMWALIVHTVYAMPSEMKNEPVCFLAPGLTWNSTNADVKKCFGKPTEKGKYNDVTGNVTDTYNLQYEDRPVTAYTTRRAFLITEILCKRRVHSYRFIIDCACENDAKMLFEKLCSELINSKAHNKQFKCEKENESEFYAHIAYGPCSISYGVEYDVTDGENEVYFYADALY